jgi:hypothetical protein
MPTSHDTASSGPTRWAVCPGAPKKLYKLVVSRFQDAVKNPQGYGLENAVYASAVLAHYIEDAHQPFHSVANYDGQLTNQRGIHSRFETDLPLRNRVSLTRTLAPVKIHPIANIKEFVFDTLTANEAMVAGILDADRTAAEGREFYDDVYFAGVLQEHASHPGTGDERRRGCGGQCHRVGVDGGRQAAPASHKGDGPGANPPLMKVFLVPVGEAGTSCTWSCRGMKR